jgi:hypothetical protein
MIDKNKASTIVSQLTRLTYENLLKWKVTQPPDTITDGSNSRFPYYAVVRYKDKNLAYFEERYKYHHDEFAYDWIETAKLMLLDEDYRMIYIFPETTALKDLADTIKESTANIDDLFSDLLVEYNSETTNDYVEADDYSDWDKSYVISKEKIPK